MKHKTLFRMLLKVIGVWVLVEGFVRAFGQLAYFTLLLTTGGAAGPTGQFWYSVVNVVAILVQLAIGFYLFLGGKWIADKAIPGNRPYCHECGYDLTNAAGNLCSECGTPFKPAEMSSIP